MRLLHERVGIFRELLAAAAHFPRESDFTLKPGVGALIPFTGHR